MHNVNVDALRETVSKTKDDASVSRFPLNVNGHWQVEEDKPQFAGTLKYPQGELALFADALPNFGGRGRAPAPMLYCFWAGIACYCSTFANVAALEGVEIKSMSIEANGTLDFSASLGLTDDPFIEDLTWRLVVETDASDKMIQRVRHFTDEQCPAVWMMENEVHLNARVVRKETPDERIA